jgi:hypothetical protein
MSIQHSHSFLVVHVLLRVSCTLLACDISHTCASNTHMCATHFSCALAARLSTLLASAISRTCASNTHMRATHFSCASAARLSTLLDLPEDQMEESLSSLVVKKTVYVAPPISLFFQCLHPVHPAHVTNPITAPSQCSRCVSLVRMLATP